MQFRDGQLLTAEDINKYLINREGSLDTSAQTAKNTEYASAIQAAQTRLDKISGTVINFPGYSTNIVEIPLTYYQSPTNAGNTTGTPGWQDKVDYISNNYVFNLFGYSDKGKDDIINYSFNYANTVKLQFLHPKNEKIQYCENCNLDASNYPRPDDALKGYLESGKYYLLDRNSYLYTVSGIPNVRAATGGFTPLNSDVYNVFLIGKFDRSNLPKLFAEVAA